MFCLSQPSEVSQGSPVHLEQVMAQGNSLGGPLLGLTTRSVKAVSGLPPSVAKHAAAYSHRAGLFVLSGTSPLRSSN